MDIARQVRQLGFQMWSRPFHGHLPTPTKNEQALIDELRSAFAVAPNISSSPESEAARLWTEFQTSLRHLVLTHDPREFLSWDVIMRTMFPVFPTYAYKELVHLRRQKDWNSRWKHALVESKVGRPAPFPLYTRTSANLIHDAYNLCSFEETTGISADRFQRIVEFGGGYGSMCRLFFNLGFNGRYIIYDLPLFSSLQSYFLKSNAIPATERNSHSSCERQVTLLSTDSDLLPLVQSASGEKSLFIAAWSISETPLDLRRRFLSYVSGFDAFLIAYQQRFGEMNNCDFFNAWQKETSDIIDWSRISIRHIRGGHYYLFGTRRKANHLVSDGEPLPLEAIS